MESAEICEAEETSSKAQEAWKGYESKFAAPLLPDETVIEGMISRLREFLEAFFAHSPEAKCAVVGVTGGLGGTLAAALLSDLKIPVVGVHAPMRADAKRIANARRSTAHFCSDYVQVDGFGHVLAGERLPERIFKFLSETPALAQKYTGETKTSQRVSLIRARLRMIALNDVAAKTEGKIVATESLSEILYGKVAKYGDVGDVKPFHGVFKGTEMAAIGKYMNLDEKIIARAEKEWSKRDILAAATHGYLGEAACEALEALRLEDPNSESILQELGESAHWKEPVVLGRE